MVTLIRRTHVILDKKESRASLLGSLEKIIALRRIDNILGGIQSIRCLFADVFQTVVY